MSQTAQTTVGGAQGESTLRVVAVEDSATDAELLARHLAKAGISAHIERVQTEPELIAALAKGPHELILSDFSLPQFNGLRALEVAVTHAPDTPFIFVSGTIGEERAIDALKRGATDYVLKTNLARLSSAIERALRESALRAAKASSDRQRQQQAERLGRLTRTYRMLSSTGSAILRLREQDKLLDEACRIAVDQGGYERVTLSLLDPGTTRLRPRAEASAPSPLKATIADLAIDDATESKLMARAIQNLKPALLDASFDDPETSAHDDTTIILRGYQALAALPLVINGTPIGVMLLFSSQSGVFDDSELALLAELCANLSFALQYHAKDEALQFLSYFDSLTGLAKRPLFCRRITQSLASDSIAPRSVVVFDVQKLSAVNDTLGRYVGDSLIENIAARLKSQHPRTEQLAHLAGGTFALLLDQAMPSEELDRALQQALGGIFADAFSIEGQELRPTIRCGVAQYPQDAMNADALVQHAEAALSEARSEHEKYALFSLMTKRPTSRGLALEGRLAGALDRQEFLLNYQPKIDLRSGEVHGLEALLRWRDRDDGMVPPSLFIPLLERTGAIVDVGEWVLLQAARDLADWARSGLYDIRVAVNVSTLQLRRRDFVARVLAAVAPLHAANVGGLDIEITESMLMQDLDLSIAKLTQLREAGIGVAIDDFGTGYSSLRLLAQLPIDTLKIDRSFVQDVAESRNSMTLVSTVVTLARAFDMRTVAEGVETHPQLEALRRIGCDEAQGYLFARPSSGADIIALVHNLTAARRPRD